MSEKESMETVNISNRQALLKNDDCDILKKGMINLYIEASFMYIQNFCKSLTKYDLIIERDKLNHMPGMLILELIKNNGLRLCKKRNKSSKYIAENTLDELKEMNKKLKLQIDQLTIKEKGLIEKYETIKNDKIMLNVNAQYTMKYTKSEITSLDDELSQKNDFIGQYNSPNPTVTKKKLNTNYRVSSTKRPITSYSQIKPEKSNIEKITSMRSVRPVSNHGSLRHEYFKVAQDNNS